MCFDLYFFTMILKNEPEAEIKICIYKRIEPIFD